MTTQKNQETEIRDAIDTLRKAKATLDAADIAGKRALAAKVAAEADLDAARLAYLAASEAASEAAKRVLALAFPECLPVVVLDLSKPPATPNKTAN